MEKTYKFTIPQGNEVVKTNVRIENNEVIVDVEFKEEFKPKDGDFLVSYANCVFIYSDEKPSRSDMVSSYCGEYAKKEGCIVTYFSNNWYYKDKCKYASDEEKSTFLKRLENEYHKKWNADKKCLEDVYIPKFGDIVKAVYKNRQLFSRDYMICIYPNKEFKETANFFNLPFVSMTGNLIIDHCGGTGDCCKIIPASESEKQELFDKLAEIGKIWNPDTKELEDLKWEPKHGELYYYVESWGDIFSTYRTAQIDENRIKMNNYFKTEEDAKPYSNQLKEIFKNS